jgi:HD-like signal output (HDOD) protein
MHEITALVERDPRLAAQILRISNSAQYARGSRINDIRTAVGRMGLAAAEPRPNGDRA